MKAKAILFVTISLFGLIGIGACEGDKEVSQLNQLVGSWVEKAPYTDGICDTLRFTSAKTVELYTPLQGYKFEVTQKNSIAIYNSAISHEFSFTLTENGGNEELEIFNFIDRTTTDNVKNITFVKLK
jgi:hypothetical protein